jgi:uncharacterized protein (TIGR00297 family)
MKRRLDVWLVLVITIITIAVAPYIQPPWILSVIVILASLILFLIRKTKYPAIALMVIALLYGINLLSLFVFLGTLAIVVLGELAYRSAGTESQSYIAYIVAATVGSFVVMVYLGYQAPLIVVLGVLVAVLLKSALEKRYDSLMIESLGVAMTMLLFEELNFEVDLLLLVAAVILALSVGYFSYKLRAADLSGLFSAAIIGIILIVFADVTWFFIMLTFFILGSVCTRYRFEKKREMGVAEGHGGVRGYLNVFANGLVAAVAAVLFGLSHFNGMIQPEPFLALFLGGVASAAADTIASEIGVVGDTPYLITTMEQVPHGTNGGITLTGELAGLAAAGIVALSAFLVGVADVEMVAVCTLAGFVGTNIDSVVGATLENSGRIGNAGTNLIATFGGGIFALLFFV